MKPIATKELQEAISLLTFQAGNLTATTLEEVREDIRRAIAHIQGAIFSETPHTSTKFDIYKMASTDELRPVMCGVFHDKGYKVASDSSVLVAVKDAYDEALEGHILDRKGQDIIGAYPKWESVFPREDDDRRRAFTIDTAKVYELLRQEKAEKKAAGKHGKARPAYVKVGDTFFRADKLAMACTFMDAYGTREIITHGTNRAAAIYAPDGSKALVMPAYYARATGSNYYTKDDETVAEVFENGKDACLWLEVA